MSCARAVRTILWSATLGASSLAVAGAPADGAQAYMSASVASAPNAVGAGTKSTSNLSTNAIEQSTIDAAMERMRERQHQRKAEVASQPALARVKDNAVPANQPSREAPAPATKDALASLVAPTTRPATPAPDLADYSRDLVTTKKLDLLRAYDVSIARARQSLRKREIPPVVVRDLLLEQSVLMRLPLDKFRDLLYDVDYRNAQRVDRYRGAFGELNPAAKTVITILIKAGAIESALALPDDPLSEELELARGVRRVYFQFVLPAREGSTHVASTPRKHSGFVEFQLSLSQGLWVPVWADFAGEPLPLFEAEAFVPLRPYRISFDTSTNSFVVAQEHPASLGPVLSLLAPAPR